MRLSVIIPTLNEARELGETVRLVRSRSVDPAIEIIVADSGSTDDTSKIASETHLRVTVGSSLNSRAGACNAGARLATGDTLLFLHADSHVPPRFDAMIMDALKDPHVVGGAFEFKLAGPEWRLRLVEIINRLRYRCRARYYGDQGIFVRRATFEAVGGYPDIPIMEDARFCQRVLAFGAMPLLPAPMLTSPRRFYNGGILRTLALDFSIGTLDYLRLNPAWLAEKYHRENQLRGTEAG